MSLTKKQIIALDELFANGGDEFSVQQKFNIKRHVWQKWLDDYYFTAEASRRHDALQRRADIMLAAYKPVALAILMSLCQSDNEEVSRKACVELLYLKFSGAAQMREIPEPQAPQVEFSQETHSKLLEILAEDKTKQMELKRQQESQR